MGKTQQQIIAEQATGCTGAGDYAKWAASQGYPHCEVLDWTSSAGDWSFIVSKDGQLWYLMTQSNNYPRGGFTRHIELGEDNPMFLPIEGTAEEAQAEAWERWMH